MVFVRNCSLFRWSFSCRWREYTWCLCGAFYRKSKEILLFKQKNKTEILCPPLFQLPLSLSTGTAQDLSRHKQQVHQVYSKKSLSTHCGLANINPFSYTVISKLSCCVLLWKEKANISYILFLLPYSMIQYILITD